MERVAIGLFALMGVVVGGLGALAIVDQYAPGRWTRFGYAGPLFGGAAMLFGAALLVMGLGLLAVAFIGWRRRSAVVTDKQ